jgi:ABC-type dipeptide/oligopeptide/nickel transport system permease subunit
MTAAKSNDATAASEANALAEVSLGAERRTRSGVGAMVRRFSQDKGAVVGAVILGLIVLAAIFAPVIAPYDPIEADSTLRLEPMGTEGHILGLDFQGRDMLSRMIWGGRVSIPNALIPVVIASAIGLLFGLIAGYMGGFVDSIIMRTVDVLLALPGIILAIAIAAAMGPSSRSVIVATSLVIVAPLTRMTYAATREQSESEYVTAARAIGTPFSRIIGRHLFPNVLAPVLVYATTIIGLLVVFTASLSFLGVGVSPPTAEWGLMVDEGRSVLSVAPHISSLPGAMIAVTALCFNLIGDGLRYALDPRQHTG